MPVVGGLVALGGVSPDGASRVQIDRPHENQLTGAGSGEQLQIDESGHLAARVRPDGVHVPFGHRLDWTRLTGI